MNKSRRLSKQKSGAIYCRFVSKLNLFATPPVETRIVICVAGIYQAVLAHIIAPQTMPFAKQAQALPVLYSWKLPVKSVRGRRESIIIAFACYRKSSLPQLDSEPKIIAPDYLCFNQHTKYSDYVFETRIISHGVFAHVACRSSQPQR